MTMDQLIGALPIALAWIFVQACILPRFGAPC